METPENPMYVSIEAPIKFRKEILESAVDVTTVLKTYEDYKILRDKKTKKLIELKGTLLDIKKVYRNLIKDLPELPEEKKPIEEKEVKVDKVKEIKTEEPKEVKIEPPKVHVSREEDQLTKELMDIQKKLRNL